MNEKFCGLNRDQLKIIAAISMTSDHIGYMIFPDAIALRITGRLAFPLFSYFIWQGSKYTHDKKKYLSGLLILGLLCILGYYVYCREIYLNSLISFSMSLCILYGIQYFKNKAKQNDIKRGLRGLSASALCIFVSYLVCKNVFVDYGFQGVMLPVFAEVFDSFQDNKISERFNLNPSLLGFATGLIWLSYSMGGTEFFSLFSLPLLIFYNGQKGKYNLKGFFYWFYPLHLLAIGAIAAVIG
ncbi:MAG: conjugal transfer protein TraX [Clostridiales bacterium]|nr:conjugal transfer protein TraX [Clostridiales bacterium]